MFLVISTASIAQHRPSPTPSASPQPSCSVCRCNYVTQTRVYRIIRELADGTPIRGSLASLQKIDTVNGSTYSRNCAALAANNGRPEYSRNYNTDYEAQETCSAERTVSDQYCATGSRLVLNKPCICKVSAAVTSNNEKPTTSTSESFQGAGTGIDRCSDMNTYYIDETTWYPQVGPTPSAGGYLGIATHTACR